MTGYDHTSFPRARDWSFTRFYINQSVASGYQLHQDAPLLLNAFEVLHHKHGLLGELEIPMDSLARAVEIVLKESEMRDAPGYRPDPALWSLAVRSCGYVQSRQAVSSELRSFSA